MDHVHGIIHKSLPILVEEELALGDDANWGNCRFYVGASRYGRQLREFHRHFPADKVCVLSFEKLLADPATELARLFEFLEIPPPHGPLSLPKANGSRAARFPVFNSALHRSGAKRLVSSALKSVFPERLSQAAKSMYYRRGVRTVSEEDLAQVAALLRNAGLGAGDAAG